MLLQPMTQLLESYCNETAWGHALKEWQLPVWNAALKLRQTTAAARKTVNPAMSCQVDVVWECMELDNVMKRRIRKNTAPQRCVWMFTTITTGHQRVDHNSNVEIRTGFIMKV